MEKFDVLNKSNEFKQRAQMLYVLQIMIEV